ncbi:MAG TPA: hypothetical protein VG013_13175 [Gemmataceae bacterium]|jgi:hypothetical protein|nr:hypothetical protein [Gemmataceae bacterium]
MRVASRELLHMCMMGALAGLGVPPSSAAQPRAATTGIAGIALVGPVRPVPRPGQPNTRPLPGAIITVHPADGGPEITRVAADKDGRFQIDLDPAKYLLVPLPPQPGPFPRGTPQTVVVKSTGLTRVVVQYDSGIRIPGRSSAIIRGKRLR